MSAFNFSKLIPTKADQHCCDILWHFPGSSNKILHAPVNNSKLARIVFSPPCRPDDMNNLLTNVGMLQAIKDVLRLRPGGLLFAGVPCSSWLGFQLYPWRYCLMRFDVQWWKHMWLVWGPKVGLDFLPDAYATCGDIGRLPQLGHSQGLEFCTTSKLKFKLVMVVSQNRWLQYFH